MKIVFGRLLIAAPAIALSVLNAAAIVVLYRLLSTRARSGRYGLLMSQESRLQYLQQRTLRRRNPLRLPQRMTRRRIPLYDSQR
jgi:hypothetical protein